MDGDLMKVVLIKELSSKTLCRIFVDGADYPDEVDEILL